MREAAGRPLAETLRDHLRDKRLLLVLDNTDAVSESLGRLADLALDRGDHVEARALLAAALTTQAQTGQRARIAQSLETFAGLAAAEGQPAQALRLARAAAAVLERIGAAREPSRQGRLERRLAPADRALDGPAAAVAWAEGQAMTLEQAVAYALEDNTDTA